MPRLHLWVRYLSPFAALALCVVACSDKEAERVGTVSSPVDAPLPDAYCTAQVQGIGAIDTETDYLPNVVNCEHGAADLEALKVMAIAARSVLYHSLATHGDICDGTSCQVYSCSRTPDAIHQQAVDETSGVYLAYNGNVTYAAYRAGDPNTAAPTCEGPADPSCITYNEGLSGTDVEQTGSLWVHDPSDAGYGTNRGCMSQNGSSCLEEELGYNYLEILHFYYGEDIELIQAPGPCVLPLPGEGGAGGSPSTGGAAVGGAPMGGSPSTGGAVAGAGGDGVPPGLTGGEEEEGCGCRQVGAGSGLPAGTALWVGLWGLVLWGRRLSRRRRSA